MKRSMKNLLRGIVLGILLLIAGAMLAQINSIMELIIAFYREFSAEAIVSLIAAGLIPGITFGRTMGPKKQKEN